MEYNLSQSSFSAESGTEPITLAEAKTWCKIELDITEENSLITQLITSARMQCEGYLGISLIERTVTALINNPLGNIELPYGPVVAIASLSDSEEGAIATDDYQIRGIGFNKIETPCYCNMTAVYTAGYPGGIPANFKTAILNQVLYLYENRGDDKSISPNVLQALKPFRRIC